MMEGIIMMNRPRRSTMYIRTDKQLTADRRARGFTVIELLVVIGIIVLLIGMIFPAISMVKRTAARTKNGVQLVNIQQGMVEYSRGNREFYPGWNGFEFDKHDPTMMIGSGEYGAGYDHPGSTVESRYGILLYGDYIQPGVLISPFESSLGKDWEWYKQWDPSLSDSQQANPQDDPIIAGQYSYAMLQIRSAGDCSSTSLDSASSGSGGRRLEWCQTGNAKAAIMADRAIAPEGSGFQEETADDNEYLDDNYGVYSNQTNEPGYWEGNVVWNDGRSTFEDELFMDTTYGTYRNNYDNIFRGGMAGAYDNNIAKGDENNRNTNYYSPSSQDKNAVMVFRGCDTRFDDLNRPMP